MKNPYKKGKVHPSSTTSPPPWTPPPTTAAAFLSLLPATILALSAGLTPQDKQVLAYLISCCDHRTTVSYNQQQRKNKKSTVSVDHGPTFECTCFMCYTTFWAQWDASSNRHVIHEIIEAYEEALTTTTTRYERKKNGTRKSSRKRLSSSTRKVMESEEVTTSSDTSFEDGGGEVVEEEEEESSAVRKIVSFVGDKIIGNFWRG